MMRIVPVKLIFVLMSLLSLAACAPRQFHMTDVPESQIVKVTPQDTLNILTVNGRVVGPQLIGRDRELLLSPGTQVFILKYKDIYDTSSDTHEVVESIPFKVSFKADAGQTYYIKHKEIKRLRDAEVFAEDVKVMVTDIDGKEVDTQFEMAHEISKFNNFFNQSDYVFESERNKQGSQYAIAPIAQADNIKETGLDISTATKQMQDIWVQATPEERAEFIKWIYSQ